MNDAFVKLQADRITIEGGLCFSKKTMLYVGNHPDGASVTPVTIMNNHFIGSHPRWYEVIQWWDLIQLIRKYSNSR